MSRLTWAHAILREEGRGFFAASKHKKTQKIRHSFPSQKEIGFNRGLNKRSDRRKMVHGLGGHAGGRKDGNRVGTGPSKKRGLVIKGKN